MFIVGNLFIALASVVHGLCTLAIWVLLARIVASWVNPSPPPGFVRNALTAVYRLTDPVLDGARRMLPFLVAGGIDFSPIVVFLLLRAVDTYLTRTLLQLGAALS